MSFAQTLWDSLTSTYVHPLYTEPTNDNTSGRQEQLRQRQLVAFQQLGASQAQRQCYSHPRQSLQCSVLQLQCQEYPYSRSEMQSSSYALQPEQPCLVAHQYTKQYNNGLDEDYSICRQAQYGVVQSTTRPPTSGVSPKGFPSHTAEFNGQVVSTHWDPINPSNQVHGGDVYESLLQQPSYTGVGYSNACTGQQLSSDYNQHCDTACNSYLSPAGVPFDLHQPSSHGQIVQARADSDENLRPEYTEAQPDTYNTFCHAFGTLMEDEPKDVNLPQHETQSAMINPLLAQRPNYSDDKKVDKKRNTLQVCFSPKSSMPKAQLCHDRKQGKYMQRAKQSGFGFTAPAPKAKPHFTAPYSFIIDNSGTRDLCHAKRQLRNTGRVSSHRVQSSGEKEHGDNRFKSTRANLSKESNVTSSQTAAKRPFRVYDHHGRSLWSARFSREDRGPVSVEKLSSHAAHGSHTAKLASEIPTAPPTIKKPVQTLEHSVGSSGLLQTTASEVRPISTTTTCRSRKAYVSRSCDQEIKAELISHDRHVPADFIKELTGGIPLLADTYQVFDAACDQKASKPETQMDPPDNGIMAERVLFNDTSCSHESSGSKEGIVAASNKATSRPSKLRDHRHSTGNSMLPVSPSKYFEGPDSPDCIGTATAPETSRNLEGEIFCTELQDMYKGKKATVVQEKIGNSRNNTLIVELPGEATVKEGKEVGGNGVMVDHAYDSDSSGGIVLLPSDLETELWAVVKTEAS